MEPDIELPGGPGHDTAGDARRGAAGGNAHQIGRAEAQLLAVLSDPSQEQIHEAADKLLQFVQLRTDGDTKRVELARVLGQPALPPPMRQLLTDYFWLLRKVEEPGQLETDEMSE